MDGVLTLLETLEEMMDRSTKLPFTKKTLVDKEEVLDVVKEIRLKLPDELKQAKWVKAYEQKAEIIDSANAFSKDLISGTKEYADGILADLENNLKEKLEIVKNNRKELK